MLSAASLKRVIVELRDLSKNKLQDIHVQVNEGDISDIITYIHGPEGTPFEGGVWKIKLYLGSDFPSAPPKGVFVTKIFHPNVSSSGEICVDTLKKDWNQTMGIRHVLLTVKCLLIHPNPESALNEEAGRLLLEKYEDYCRHARLMTSIHAKKIKWEQLTSTAEKEDKLKEVTTKENDTSANNISFEPNSTQKNSLLPRRPKNSSLKRL